LNVFDTLDFRRNGRNDNINPCTKLRKLSFTASKIPRLSNNGKLICLSATIELFDSSNINKSTLGKFIHHEITSLNSVKSRKIKRSMERLTEVKIDEIPKCMNQKDNDQFD
jgi:hypothetical protein